MAFYQIDEEKIGNDDYGEVDKIKRGRGDKTEGLGQGAERQSNTNSDNTE